MAPKKDNAKRGRAKGAINWTAQETTALGRAAIEASEKPDQKLALLESGCAAHYPQHLQDVCAETGGWVAPLTSPNYTAEDSIRGRVSAGKLWTRFTSTAFKGHLVNTVGPIFDQVCPDGAPASGKQRDDAILEMKEKLWAALRQAAQSRSSKRRKTANAGGAASVPTSSSQASSTAPEGGPEAAVSEAGDGEEEIVVECETEGAAGFAVAREVEENPGPLPDEEDFSPASGTDAEGNPTAGKWAPRPMPVGWDGGVTFPFWLEFGPFGKNHSILHERPAPPPPQSEGRAAVRLKDWEKAIRARAQVLCSGDSGGSGGSTTDQRLTSQQERIRLQDEKLTLMKQQIKNQQKEASLAAQNDKVLLAMYSIANTTSCHSCDCDAWQANHLWKLIQLFDKNDPNERADYMAAKEAYRAHISRLGETSDAP